MPELRVGDQVRVIGGPTGFGLVGILHYINTANPIASNLNYAVDFGVNLGWTHNCNYHPEAILPHPTGYWFRSRELELTELVQPAPTSLTCSQCSKTMPLDKFPERSQLGRSSLWNNICLVCAEDMFSCDYCFIPTPNDDMQTDNNEHRACPSCADIMQICEGCGDFNVHGEYCEECDNSDEDDGDDDYDLYMHSADFKPSPWFYPTQSNTIDLYLGVELETDNYPDNSAKISTCEQLDFKEIYLKEDGSLNDGVEIVSHPATLSYHLDTLPWSAITKIVKDNGGKSHNTSTCGIHVHFNKEFFNPNLYLNTLKLINLSRKFWTPLVKFSRRNQEQLNGWAHPYSSHDDYTLRKNLPDKIRQARNYGKYSAFNISGSSTIEIRIFRGTLLLDSFFACLEMVDALVRFAKKQPIASVERITWKGFTRSLSKKRYPYLVSYLRRKELCA